MENMNFLMKNLKIAIEKLKNVKKNLFQNLRLKQNKQNLKENNPFFQYKLKHSLQKPPKRIILNHMEKINNFHPFINIS